MLFVYSKGKWFKDSGSILTIVSRVDIACHTTSLYHSFSCRYSMSYDISISLLKKNFLKAFLVKALGKGELNFKRRVGGQSNMTTFLYKPDQSHMTISIPLAVPCKYSESSPYHGSTLRVLRPAPFSIFPKTLL
jgi:hypothetical protein